MPRGKIFEQLKNQISDIKKSLIKGEQSTKWVSALLLLAFFARFSNFSKTDHRKFQTLRVVHYTHNRHYR